MDFRRYTATVIVAIILLHFISDSAYAEKTASSERSLFRPLTADFGVDHFHLELLSYERNLIETDDNSYINGQVTLYERFNLAQSNQSYLDRPNPWNIGVSFEALMVPGVEIGRRFEKGLINRAGFYGAAGLITPDRNKFINTGFMVQTGPVQLKAGVFRGVIHHKASTLDNLDDLSLNKPYDQLTAVSYITVGLSPTFSF